jgi:monovalent cation/hydrogen antiporter
VLVAARFAWLFTTVYLIRLVDRRPQLRRISTRARVVSGLSGFRGAVSLAAALAVPRGDRLRRGLPRPRSHHLRHGWRDSPTLVAQGLLLPSAVRWARLPRDASVEQERKLADRLGLDDIGGRCIALTAKDS